MSLVVKNSDEKGYNQEYHSYQGFTLYLLLL